MELMNFLVVLCGVLTVQVDSSKILGVFWSPSKSHHVAASALLKALAKKGHDVHLLSCFNDEVNIPTYRQELLTGILGSLDDVANPNTTVFEKIMAFSRTTKDYAEKLWKNEPIQRLIKTKPKYDVVILLYFMNEFTLALPNYLEAPTIIIATMGSNPVLNSLVGNQNLPYAKHVLTPSPVTTFRGRLETILANAAFYNVLKFYTHPLHDKINREYFPNCPSTAEMIQHNISLVFNNGHYAIESARPNVPNLVQIGGFHTSVIKKLPQEYQEFLDSAKHGAVLFSMGTNLKLKKDFGEVRVENILKALGNLAPVKVLLKTDPHTEFDKVPQNIFVTKWLPQNDVLAHPNIKLFVTHGGLGGVTEAVYHGVPILGIPIFADQKDNVENSVQGGYGARINLEDITEETFGKAVKKVLNNPEFGKNARKRSNIFRNQPMNPLDKAIWWVEHIIEHKGGEHLRNVGVELEWYQLYMLDVLAFLLIVMITISLISVYITLYVFKKIYAKIFSNSVKKLKKS